MKRFCQTLDLKDDPKLIEQYCYWHQHIWKEIPEGIRAVGISNMEIYRLGNRLFMIVETPDDFTISIIDNLQQLIQFRCNNDFRTTVLAPAFCRFIVCHRHKLAFS